MSNNAEFQTTIWTQVLNARAADDTESRQALADLCRRYWYPIYSYVRRRGYAYHDAQDLTQGFFSELLGKEYLQKLENRDGRFRSFLLTSLKWFLANEWNRAQAVKRGGGSLSFSLDESDAEDRFQAELQADDSPELSYDRQFARASLQRALQRLRSESEEVRFNALSPYLLPKGGEPSYAETASALGMSETAIKSAIRRMRQRCGELFREEVGETVNATSEIDEEIRYLLSLLAGR
jgi:RNA polymerase sigma factor (sigma-70 family)